MRRPVVSVRVREYLIVLQDNNKKYIKPLLKKFIILNYCYMWNYEMRLVTVYAYQIPYC